MKRPRVSVFLGVSLDGYIAGESDDLSWLSIVQTDPPEDTGYEALMREVDVLVLGRNTYEKVLTFGDWPYHGKRVIVLTHHALYPRHGEEAHGGDLCALLAELGAAGHAHVYLDGGMAVRDGLAAGVVDTLTLSWVPVILGQGTALFGVGMPTSKWRLVSSRAFPSGLVQARYQPV